MDRGISDPDVRMLAAIAGMLQADYVDPEEETIWGGSPFAWIRTRPSRQRGKIGEQLVAGWCAAKDLDVNTTRDSEADRVIGGYRTEIKFPTLWKAGHYAFQQFRDQNYQIAVCLGISPFDAHCWVLTKQVLYEHVIGHTGQHGGRRGGDTAWPHVDPAAPPEWLRGCGGSLQAALVVLRALP